MLPVGRGSEKYCDDSSTELAEAQPLYRPELGREMSQKKGRFGDLKTAQLFFPRVDFQNSLDQIVDVTLSINPARDG